jgi:hypothetical protein
MLACSPTPVLQTDYPSHRLFMRKGSFFCGDSEHLIRLTGPRAQGQAATVGDLGRCDRPPWSV